MLAHGELRNRLIQFLSDELSLDSFEDWFVQRSWNMHKIPILWSATCIRSRVASRRI